MDSKSRLGRAFRAAAVSTHALRQAVRTLRDLAAIVIAGVVLAGAWGSSHAAIPASERTVLVNLYNSTGGASWNNSTGWNGAAGTECTWFGVGCDVGGNHVVFLGLASNNLAGTLPALGNLTALQFLGLGSNSLTGSIPSLAGLTSLASVFLDHNDLTGSIPSLTGLSALRFAYFNSNQLTGSIPSLAGLTALEEFVVSLNQLTGPLPALTGLTALREFEAGGNQLTGSIPSLTGLTNLTDFSVVDNLLTGPMPSLAGLTALSYFNVGANQLTGSVPSLAGLTSLQSFYIFLNQLTGPMALPPSPSALVAGQSNLCANQLQSTGNASADQAWDVASGSTPVFGQAGWLSCQGFDFGNQILHTTSAPRVLTIAATVNSGVISFTSIGATGDFAQTNNCPANLQPGFSCSINVTFTPQALGSRTGDLTVVGGTVFTGQITGVLPLRGNGVAAPIPTVAPAIPTLSETSLWLLAALLGLLGLVGTIRRA